MSFRAHLRTGRLAVLPAMVLCGLPGLRGSAQTPSATQGTELLNAHKLSEARDVFEAVLTRDPGNTEAQAGEVAASEGLALDARAAHKTDDALRDLVRARSFAPRNARLLYDLGVLEDQMKLYRDADESLTAAEEINRGDPKLIYAIARVKMDLGQLAVAETRMREYLKLKPDDASAHYGLGRIYQIGVQFSKAKAEFERSVELQPVQTEAYFQLGEIALKQGEFDSAIEQFSKTLVRDPRHGGALEGTGEANFKLKHYEQAKDSLERAVEAAPDFAPCHYYLGLTLARLGRKEDSERELAIASKMADEQNQPNQLRVAPSPTGP